MTSFYSWRLMFLTFYGEARGDKHTHDHAHESPLTMLIPLGVLAVGAVLAGMVWYNSFFGHTDKVAKFYGIPYAEAAEAHGEANEAHGDDHAEDKVHAKDKGYGGDHHYVFTGKPGEGALYIAPDNTLLDDAHAVPKWVKVSLLLPCLLVS